MLWRARVNRINGRQRWHDHESYSSSPQNLTLTFSSTSHNGKGVWRESPSSPRSHLFVVSRQLVCSLPSSRHPNKSTFYVWKQSLLSTLCSVRLGRVALPWSFPPSVCSLSWPATNFRRHSLHCVKHESREEVQRAAGRANGNHVRDGTSGGCAYFSLVRIRARPDFVSSLHHIGASAHSGVKEGGEGGVNTHKRTRYWRKA